MRLLLIALFTVCLAHAQQGTYPVLQTLSGRSQDSLRPVGKNSIVDKIILKKDSMQVWAFGYGTANIPFADCEKKEFGKLAYSYTVYISEQIKLELFIGPYPGENSNPKLIRGLVTIKGAIKDKPECVVYERLVFHPEHIALLANQK